MSSPPISRRQLSVQMRRKRIDAELTLEDAAEALEWSQTKVSNLETGRSKYPAVTDVGLLLGVYGVTDERERESILNLCRQARQRGWWNRYDDVLTGAYASLEAGTTALRVYEPLYIPGLLQTAEYAAAVTQTTLIRKPDDIERVVEARMKRQEILEREDPASPELWAIVDEHALEILAHSDPKLHRSQVEHLITLAEAPNTVTIQVLPSSAGMHAGMGGSFVIMDYNEPELAIVFIETSTDGLYLDQPSELDRYRKVFDRLLAKALDPDDVPDYLRKLIT